ncbi:MAG: hypothetical protein ACI8ZM_001286 [Crocinitomix sp.]|jgi:hypothetical protein
MKYKYPLLVLAFTVVSCISTETEYKVEENYKTDSSTTKIVTTYNSNSQTVDQTTTTFTTSNNPLKDKNILKVVNGLDCDSITINRIYGDDYPNRVMFGEHISMDFYNVNGVSDNYVFRTIIVSNSGDTIDNYFSENTLIQLEENSSFNVIKIPYQVRAPLFDGFPPEGKYKWTTQIIDTVSHDTLQGSYTIAICSMFNLSVIGKFERSQICVYDLKQNDIMVHDTLSKKGEYAFVIYGFGDYESKDDKAFLGIKMKMCNSDNEYLYNWIEPNARRPKGIQIDEIADSLVIPIKMIDSENYTDRTTFYVKIWDNNGYYHLELSYRFFVRENYS